jgi:Sigma-70, region 4
MRRELAAALATLSEPVRRAIELRVVDELPYADLAARLQISEQAARARVSRGLTALADVLDAPAIREATTLDRLRPADGRLRGAELARAGERVAVRRARRRRLTVGGLAVAACLATVLVLLGVGSGGGRRLDVVAQARAALAPPQEIVHVVVTSSLIKPPRGPSRPLTTEQWYARGVQRIYRSRDNTLNVYRGTRGPFEGTRAVLERSRRRLRAMLAVGRLRDTGEVTVGGRTVRRLIGQERVHEARGTFAQRTTYDVDPQTFAPLGGTVEFVLAHGAKVAMRFHVDR